MGIKKIKFALSYPSNYQGQESLLYALYLLSTVGRVSAGVAEILLF